MTYRLSHEAFAGSHEVAGTQVDRWVRWCGPPRLRGHRLPGHRLPRCSGRGGCRSGALLHPDGQVGPLRRCSRWLPMRDGHRADGLPQSHRSNLGSGGPSHPRQRQCAREPAGQSRRPWGGRRGLRRVPQHRHRLRCSSGLRHRRIRSTRSRTVRTRHLPHRQADTALESDRHHARHRP